MLSTCEYSIFGFNSFCIELILISNRIGERMLPCGTPWGYQADWDCPIFVWNFLFFREVFNKVWE